MASQITEAMEAVRDAINSASWSLPFIAEASYLPVYKLEDMHDLHVTIVPRSDSITLLSRDTTTRDVVIDIAVQKKLSDENAYNNTGELLAFVEELIQWITSTRSFGSWQWILLTNEPIYSAEHMREMNQFTSVVSVTLKKAISC
jgi:hypothetical protein